MSDELSLSLFVAAAGWAKVSTYYDFDRKCCAAMYIRGDDKITGYGTTIGRAMHEAKVMIKDLECSRLKLDSPKPAQFHLDLTS